MKQPRTVQYSGNGSPRLHDLSASETIITWKTESSAPQYAGASKYKGGHYSQQRVWKVTRDEKNTRNSNMKTDEDSWPSLPSSSGKDL